MISTAKAVKRILASPAPVLLGDTCVFLDLIRDPTREGLTGANVDAAHRLIARAEAKPPTVWIVLISQVLSEIAANREPVKQASEAAIKKLEEQVLRVKASLSSYGLTVPAPTLIAAGLPEVASVSLQRILDASLHLTTPKGVNSKVWTRIAANAAPAQKGQQAKDCLIIESYLHVCRQLRIAGYALPVVFFTSNTQDYSTSTQRSQVHPTLAEEFEVAQMRYAVNFGMAENLLS
jgi:hypothetical protein